MSCPAVHVYPGMVAASSSSSTFISSVEHGPRKLGKRQPFTVKLFGSAPLSGKTVPLASRRHSGSGSWDPPV